MFDPPTANHSAFERAKSSGHRSAGRKVGDGQEHRSTLAGGDDTQSDDVIEVGLADEFSPSAAGQFDFAVGDLPHRHPAVLEGHVDTRYALSVGGALDAGDTDDTHRRQQG